MWGSASSSKANIALISVSRPQPFTSPWYSRFYPGLFRMWEELHAASRYGEAHSIVSSPLLDLLSILGLQVEGVPYG